GETGVTLSGPTGDAGNDGILSIGETWTYTGNYTVLQSDIDSNGKANHDGNLTDTASVTTSQGAMDSETVNVVVDQDPSVVLTKSFITTPTDTVNDANKADHAGQVIAYTITVANNGNESLTGVLVTDTGETGLTLGNHTDTGSGTHNDAIFDIGETWTSTGNYTVLQSD